MCHDGLLCRALCFVVELRLSCVGHCQQPVSRALQKYSSECGRTIANTVQPMYDYNTPTHTLACMRTHIHTKISYICKWIVLAQRRGRMDWEKSIVSGTKSKTTILCVCVCVCVCVFSLCR